MNIDLRPLKTKQSGDFYYTPFEKPFEKSLPVPFSSAKRRKGIVYYPERDGKPMADNTRQFNWIVKIKEGFEFLFAKDPDIFIAGDLLWYTVEGNNKISTAPDTMIVFGRPKGDRGSYRSWDEENINPQIVFEILSPSSRKKDMAWKLEFYERYGVEEYYIYDPDRIVFSVYIRSGMNFNFVENVQKWISPRLEVRFEISNQNLRIFTPEGREFVSPLEMALERGSEHQRAEEMALERGSERQRAEEMSLERDSEHQRAEAEHQRAEAERQRAEAERQRAEAEHQRAEQLADRLRELGITVD